MKLEEFVTQIKARVDEFATICEEASTSAEYEKWAERFLIWEEQKYNVALDPDDRACDACEGSGQCSECIGKGCAECEDSGDCPVCDGSGVVED